MACFARLRLSRFRPRRLGLRARITTHVARSAPAARACCSPARPTSSSRQTRSVVSEASALRQTYVNACVVRDSLRSADPEVPQLLASLQTPAGSFPLVLFGDRWFPLTLEYGRDALPAELAERVAAGSAAAHAVLRSAATRSSPSVSRSSDMSASYFEIVSLSGARRTRCARSRLVLDRRALLGTTLLGALLWRVWASRRAVSTSRATRRKRAQAIAGGNLDTRLDVTDDRDSRAA